jgi:hypothetical protein
MTDVTPEILQSVVRIMAQFPDQASVRSFLKSPTVHKDNAARFLAYLISFGLVPPDPGAIVTAISGICEDYVLRMNNTLGDSIDEPLTRLTPVQTSTISTDLRRGIFWFHARATEIGIPEEQRADPILRVSRVLALLALSSSDNDYIQGYDRFALLSYALALNFVITVNIPVTALVAEPLTCLLTEKLIGLSEAPQLLTDNLEGILRYYKTDRAIKKHFPVVAARLKQDRACARHFALTWELSLWADRHTANNLLLVWDALIAHRKDLLRFKRALTLAHIKQLRLNEGRFILQELNEFSDWDVVELVKAAEKFLVKPNKVKGVVMGLCGAGCLILGVGIAIAVRRRAK